MDKVFDTFKKRQTTSSAPKRKLERGHLSGNSKDGAYRQSLLFSN